MALRVSCFCGAVAFGPIPWRLGAFVVFSCRGLRPCFVKGCERLVSSDSLSTRKGWQNKGLGSKPVPAPPSSSSSFFSFLKMRLSPLQGCWRSECIRRASVVFTRCHNKGFLFPVFPFLSQACTLLNLHQTLSFNPFLTPLSVYPVSPVPQTDGGLWGPTDGPLGASAAVPSAASRRGQPG